MCCVVMRDAVRREWNSIEEDRVQYVRRTDCSYGPLLLRHKVCLPIPSCIGDRSIIGEVGREKLFHGGEKLFHGGVIRCRWLLITYSVTLMVMTANEYQIRTGTPSNHHLTFVLYIFSAG
jgi:hypothetical protein